MGYDELYVNKEYIKYLENKVSNEEIIQKYSLDSEKILLLNEYISLKLKIAHVNFEKLQYEICKLEEESEFCDYDRYFFTNFETINIYFETVNDINLPEMYFITSDFNALQDISLWKLGFLQKYSKTHKEHIKKFIAKNNNDVDKNDILDNSIYFIKEYVLNNKIESSINEKLKNKLEVKQILFNDDFRNLILQKLETLEIDYINNDLKRFTFLEYIVLLPLYILNIKKDKSKLGILNSINSYNMTNNSNSEFKLLENDIEIIKSLGENQLLAYCASLISKVFYIEYKELREIYLYFYSAVCFPDYSSEVISKNTNFLKKEKLFIEVDDDEHKINIIFPLYHIFINQ